MYQCQWLKAQRLNTMAFNWVARSSWSTKDCNETDWKGLEIRGFDVRVLEKTCEEVTNTKSPTWILKTYSKISLYVIFIIGVERGLDILYPNMLPVSHDVSVGPLPLVNVGGLLR